QAADLGLYIRLMDLSDLGLCKPLIAAVNGHCLGAGLEIALQCDVRIASEQASFGLPEAAVGSIPAVSGLHRLLKAVPAAHAMQMV
ncbi:enoyl-CoA hydratase-related protein, partial [Pseudomonas sp. GW460-13]|uniref:enoyl-CoA hydratase-related protein n=1 Tax=Pseudomonas sp. GW460-13 TaxID=2070590 RepID=UPI000CC9D2AD